MISFPAPAACPVLDGYTCRAFHVSDADSVMALQSAMIDTLPDPAWYYPSPKSLLCACIERGESFGFFRQDHLAGFGTLTPGYIRPDTCYAVKVGEPVEHTFDFQDVMVHPADRRRGIHTALLCLFDRLAREAGGTAIYCTIAPENRPSVTSFMKAGYRCVRVQSAYEGALRGYYRKDIFE